MNRKFVLILGAGAAATVAFAVAGLWAVTKGEGPSQTEALWQNVPAIEQSCITRRLQQWGIDSELLGAIRTVSPDDPLILPFRQQCQNQPVLTLEAQPKWDDARPNGPR